MATQGRIAWRGLSLLGKPDDTWPRLKPNVFSIRNTIIEDYVKPLVHEIKVRRADLLSVLKKPEKRAGYLALASGLFRPTFRPTSLQDNPAQTARGGNKKAPDFRGLMNSGMVRNGKMAERVGFEPTVPCGTPDFESGTFDHSATSPRCQGAGAPEGRFRTRALLP